MPRCLFCLREAEAGVSRFTDEHVFPAALGGNLVVPESSCDACNNGSSKFEQALAVELTPIRTIFQIPDRYGNVPRTPATIITNTETYEGRVEGNGSVVLKPLVTEEANERGGRDFVYRFQTERQKTRLKKEAERKGKQLIEIGPGEPVLAEIHIGGQLNVIGSEAGLRAVAKIAYVAMASIAGTALATGPAFSDVRRFIMEGKPDGMARVFFNRGYLQANQQGPHQHLVAIAGRRDTGRVDAIVRLFGELTYFVVLSTEYKGVDFFNTLLYDALRGEKNDILVGHLQAEFIQLQDVGTSPETVWDDLEGFGRNFCEFVERVVRNKLVKDAATEAER